MPGTQLLTHPFPANSGLTLLQATAGFQLKMSAARLPIIGFLLVLLLFLLHQSLTFLRQPYSQSVIRPFPPTHTFKDKLQIRQSIWSDLTRDENTRLFQWLHSDKCTLNLTHGPNATATDNTVLITELLRPNKTDALRFLDQKGPIPDRYARVTIQQNSGATPHIAEYIVGPLSKHDSEIATHPLSYVYNSGKSSTINPAADIEDLLKWIDAIAEQVADIVKGLLGTNAHGFNDLGAEAFEASSNDQVWMEDGHTMRWVAFFQKSNASTLLPQSLYFKADTTGRDPSKWRVVAWLYGGIVYRDIEKLRAASRSPGFVRLSPNIDGRWTDLAPELMPDSESHSTSTPPTFSQTGESRVYLDESGSFVSWVGLTFNYAFSQVNGVALYDVRLDGERVLYELALQEAMAHYAGNDPVQSSTAFLDSLFGIGSRVTELVPGYDCPAYAHYVDLEYHRMGNTYKRRGSLCIFEVPTEYPLQRHSQTRAVTSFANSKLIVRTIAVIGNYDYLLDYIFYLDGTIEIMVRASGYIQGAYAFNNSRYGYRIHETLSSSIHDHIINFKADLDIGGANNSLSVVSIKPGDVQYPWSTTGSRHTMTLERSLLETEDDGALDWPSNSGSMYVMVGPPNGLGERRGYRIMPGTGVGTPVHLTVQNSSVLQNAAEWAAHDLFVTRQKDTEPRSSSPANALTPADPLVAFDKFLDGESLVDEDLVVWFNLGTHHVPHTGDLPNTLMTTSASSVMLAPHNYHMRDRSRALTPGVRVDMVEGGDEIAVSYFGEERELDNFRPSPQPVRKFPSDILDVAL